jgi:hypothetical protein
MDSPYQLHLKSYMRFFYFYILLVTIYACKYETRQVGTEERSVQQAKECPPGKDTINLVTTFTIDTVKAPTERFYSIAKFIKNKGFFKPNINKTGKLKIEKETTKTFPVAYDTCNMKRSITKNFIMKNIQVTTLGFVGTEKDKFSGFIPGMHFEEWKFANNTDRDSAMKIVQMVYNYPNNVVMYEKRYSQFMIDENRVYLLETGAKFAEPYAIEYKNLIEKFIKTNKDLR